MSRYPPYNSTFVFLFGYTYVTCASASGVMSEIDIVLKFIIQSTLVISTSVISNNRLSRRENLIPVLT